MKRPVDIATKTTTSRAVRVSIGFVVATASVVALLGAVAIISRMINS